MDDWITRNAKCPVCKFEVTLKNLLGEDFIRQQLKRIEDEKKEKERIEKEKREKELKEKKEIEKKKNANNNSNKIKYKPLSKNKKK